MKKAFVFFTNEDNLTQVPIKLPQTNILNHFSNNEKTIISKTKKLIEENGLPYLVLIQDTIELPNPDENGKEHEETQALFNIFRNIDEIYIVIHKTQQGNYLQTFQRLFPHKLKGYLIEGHESQSLYEIVLGHSLANDLSEDLSKFENLLINKIIQREPVIQLWKKNILEYIKQKNESVTIQESINALKEQLKNTSIHSPELCTIISNLTPENYRTSLDKIGNITESMVSS